VLRDVTDPAATFDDDITVPTVPPADDGGHTPAKAKEAEAEAAAPKDTRRRWKSYPWSAPTRRRIDVKLIRRDDATRSTGEESARTEQLSLGRGSYAAIGVVGAKTEENMGTLWRSAYQLGAAMLFTVSARYKAQRTDTLNVPLRLPYMHFADWAAFASASPHAAVLVGVEMGGTPLEEFEHPERAVYLLGSEDTGLPPSVLQACYRVVSISSERTASYNVAVAGSIVLHDRLAKRKLAVRAAEQSRQTAQVRSEQEQKQKQKQKQKQTPDPPVTPTMQPQTPAS